MHQVLWTCPVLVTVAVSFYGCLFLCLKMYEKELYYMSKPSKLMKERKGCIYMRVRAASPLSQVVELMRAFQP